jgi:hypothetical protein
MPDKETKKRCSLKLGMGRRWRPAQFAEEHGRLVTDPEVPEAHAEIHARHIGNRY